MLSTGEFVRRPLTSRRCDALPASGIRRFFDIIATMDDVISLGVGEPDFVTPEQIREAAIRSIKQGHTHYTSNFGMIQLREAIAHDLERRFGAMYDPATELMCVSGVSEGLNVACQAVLDPGDEVLSPDPYYVAYPPNVIMAGGTFVGVPTYEVNNFKLQVADLERYVTDKTRALLMGYPANPTGATMTRSELLAVAEFVKERDLVVIIDEIYARLNYNGQHTCFAALPGMKERTILLGGFSKAYAMTGWRLGYVAAPAEALEAMMKIHQYLMMSAPTPAQYAALEALRTGEEDVQLMLAEYDRRRQLVVSRFNGMGLHCFEPRGAFYAFPDISSTALDDESFAERLLFEERVAVVPGSAFGECGKGHVRACYATSYEKLVEALDRIESFVRRCHAERANAT
ncbi:MAG TPA: aminotransferase class I/II-fold pyridoxal phosphate-dependent enzyme [Dehalococcoidia bacterium]|nr:aminotransferase class I/II-fold pyridoxal phosphate-dependent enzyme [Dehalococcoidia bacterium]